MSAVTFDSYRDFPGYIVNLSRERWRYTAAREELTSVGFTNLNRLIAVDYRETDVNMELRSLGATRLERFKNDAEIACSLSHLRAMRDFLNSDEPHCFIFEDDVVPVENFRVHADFKDIQYGDFELLSFGGVYIGPTDTKGYAIWTTENIDKLKSAEAAEQSYISDVVFWGSHAYMLSRRGAHVLLQEYKGWLSSEDYKYPQLDRYISGNRNIRSKLISYKPDNIHRYSLSDYCGDFFRGVLLQRGDFKSSIANIQKK